MFSTTRSLFIGKRPIVLLTSVVLVSAIVQVLFASPVKAECDYQGKKYQTGETVGPYICMPDGTLQPQ